MQIGQHFLSKSKIQKTFTEYIYTGAKPGYQIAIEGVNTDDCVVDMEWFNNRVIKIIGGTK